MRKFPMLMQQAATSEKGAKEEEEGEGGWQTQLKYLAQLGIMHA